MDIVCSEAGHAAQETAARINRQLGLNSSDLGMQPNKPVAHSGLGLVTTENYKIPDKMVGLGKYSLPDDRYGAICYLHLVWHRQTAPTVLNPAISLRLRVVRFYLMFVTVL